jgi:hypothetical protein
LKSRCPQCLKAIDLNELLLEKEMAAVMLLMNSFGADASLVMSYAELLGCLPVRKARKTRLILEEIKRLFDAGSFKRARKAYSISRAGIIEALNVVVHRHFEAPLKGHGYLTEVMVGIAERETREAGKKAEQDLRKKEQRLMATVRDDDDGPREMEPEIRRQVDRLLGRDRGSDEQREG